MRRSRSLYFSVADRTIAIRTSISLLYTYTRTFLNPFRFSSPTPALKNADPDLVVTFTKDSRALAGKISTILVRGVFSPSRRIPPFFREVRFPLNPASILYHGCVEPLLQMMLRRTGVVPLHAIALYRGKTGVLICGPGGVGKTTTALHLLQQGWQLLNDDDSFLLIKDQTPYVWAPHGPLFISIDTVKRYPQFSALKLGPQVRRGREWKHRWENSGRSGSRYVPLRFILFPEIRPNERTKLNRMEPKQVFFTLLNQRSREQIGMYQDSLSVSKACEVFGALTSQVRGGRLRLGRDMTRIPSLLSKFLKTSSKAAQECLKAIDKLPPSEPSRRVETVFN